MVKKERQEVRQVRRRTEGQEEVEERRKEEKRKQILERTHFKFHEDGSGHVRVFTDHDSLTPFTHPFVNNLVRASCLSRTSASCENAAASWTKPGLEEVGAACVPLGLVKSLVLFSLLPESWRELRL